MRKSKIVSVILAGGKGLRMGGMNKALLKVGGQRLINKAIECLKSQSSSLAISIRSHEDWCNSYTLPIIYDFKVPYSDDYLGPLGGIASALEWSLSLKDEPSWVITTPVDLPFLPKDFVGKITAIDAEIVVAKSKERSHHALAAWKPHLLHSLKDFLLLGNREIYRFQQLKDVQEIEWFSEDFDPFFNINTLEDLAEARQLKSDNPDI